MKVTEQKLQDLIQWLSSKAKQKTVDECDPKTISLDRMTPEQAYNYGECDGETVMARDILAQLRGK